MKFEVRKRFTVHLPEQIFTLPSFEINSGEAVGVLGPSRARPDILLRLLSASLPPEGGFLPPPPGGIKQREAEVDLTSLPLYLNGEQIYEDEQVYKKIGSIFSDPDINILGRNVLEDYLSALVSVDAPPEQQIATVSLRHFGLSEKLDRRTEVLSGGEKQRLNCATALVGCRHMLVGDFTTATLDKDFRRFMCETIKSFIKEGGITIIAGLDPEDQEYIGISRWFCLEVDDEGVMVSEATPNSEYYPGVKTEAQILKGLLKERKVEQTIVLTAKEIHRREITQPLSLSVQSREIVVLIGTNGIGKSTFGQIIIGQVKKREIGGSFEMTTGVRPVMAPQAPSEILLGLDLFNELPDSRLRELCGLSEKFFEKLDPRGFSHGTQKLIGIANALRLSSGLTILDEPTSGMDFEQKKKFVELINHFPNTSILIITHDPSIEVLGRVIEMKETLK